MQVNGLTGGSGIAPLLPKESQISAEALMVMALGQMSQSFIDDLADLKKQLDTNNQNKEMLRGLASKLEGGTELTDDELETLNSFLTEAGQLSSGSSTLEEQQTAAKDALANVGDLSESISLDIQLAMGRMTRAIQAASNTAKKFDECANSIIRNMK